MNPNVIRLHLNSRWLGQRASFRLDFGNKCRLPWESSEEGRPPWTRSYEKVIHARHFVMARSTKCRFTRKTIKSNRQFVLKWSRKISFPSLHTTNARAHRYTHICIKPWIAIYVSYNRCNHMELAYTPGKLHVCIMNMRYSLHWRRLEEDTYTL